MSTLTSAVVTALTETPAEEVWGALTATGTPLSFFHDLIVESDWQPGSRLSMRINLEGAMGGWWPEGDVIFGEVLAAERPHRLSYTLGDRPSDPSTYVTWRLCPRDGSTVIRLFADEPPLYAGSHDELELVWLRIVTALVKSFDDRRQPTVSRCDSPDGDLSAGRT